MEECECCRECRIEQLEEQIAFFDNYFYKVWLPIICFLYMLNALIYIFNPAALIAIIFLVDIECYSAVVTAFYFNQIISAKKELKQLTSE